MVGTLITVTGTCITSSGSILAIICGEGTDMLTNCIVSISSLIENITKLCAA